MPSEQEYERIESKNEEEFFQFITFCLLKRTKLVIVGGMAFVSLFLIGGYQISIGGQIVQGSHVAIIGGIVLIIVWCNEYLQWQKNLVGKKDA